jgi:hypothetical protein
MSTLLEQFSYSSFIPHPLLLRFCELASLRAHVVDCALQEESLFGQVVALAVNDLAEAFDGVFEFDVLAFETGELRSDEKGL